MFVDELSEGHIECVAFYWDVGTDALPDVQDVGLEQICFQLMSFFRLFHSDTYVIK